jgi:hypothetical protein
MNQKIQVLMPGGEAREDRLRRAIEKDKQKRFAWAGNSSEIPGDIQFINGHPGGLEELFDCSTRFNVELKAFTGKEGDNSDLLGSILNGHLYLQTLKLRKGPCTIAVLGNEEDLKNACMKSAYQRGIKGEAAVNLAVNYENLVWDFEANCRGQNIGFWWLKSVPWRRILSGAHKILTEADLSKYAPKPIEGEEMVVALSIMLGYGIGPTKAKSILEKFKICLEPRFPCTFLDDCDGIGQKLAESVGKAIKIDPGMIIRPKVKKPRRAAKCSVELMQ